MRDLIVTDIGALKLAKRAPSSSGTRINPCEYSEALLNPS